MIINHPRKFIFICVPKTGSTTLSKFFVEKDKIEIEKSWYKERWHWPMTSVETQYEEVFNTNEYYKFAFHRNPWDRLVSSWIEFTTDPGHLNTWSTPLLEEFQTWENFVLNFRDSKWSRNLHFCPTAYYTHKLWTDREKIRVNFIGNYTNWTNDVHHIFEKLGYDTKEIKKLKRWRETKRKRDYKQYYQTDRMINEVALHFERDIKLFGDKF